MRIVFEGLLPSDSKDAIKRILKKFDPQDCGQPEPFFVWETSNLAVYKTASGKGKYTIDFSRTGKITIEFTGHRNSLMGGTEILRVWPPEPGILPAQWHWARIDFESNTYSGRRVISDHYKVIEIETSEPNKPLLEANDEKR